MDVDKIRKDFPLLANKINGKPIVFFDNACQSLRPTSVIEAINDYYINYSACAGRGVHTLGERTRLKTESARLVVAKFIGAKKSTEIIFTKNATEGINLLANSFGFKKGDIVLTTDKEHNSNLIPWQILVKKIGIIHKVVPSKNDNTFDIDELKKLISPKVKLVSMCYTSNLDGVTIPVKEIIKIAHKHKALVLLDAAQTAIHQKINVKDLDVDYLVLSGHKLLGPSGTGILYGKYKLLEKLNPFLVGGSTVKSSTYTNHHLFPPPAKFEAGLQNYAGIFGLETAIKYIQKIGFKNIIAQEYKLNKYITDEISQISGLSIIGPKDPALRGGIISFYVKGVDSHQIALMLDTMANIMVRSGQHCVHSWFAGKNIKRSVRISLSFYNTQEEAEIFVKSFKKVINTLS